jgi:hypothetical protein
MMRNNKMKRINKIVNTKNLIEINKKLSDTMINENNQKTMESMKNRDYYIKLIYNSIRSLDDNNTSFDNVIKILKNKLFLACNNESYKGISIKIELILQSLKLHFESSPNDNELMKRCIKLFDIIILDYYEV